MKSIASVPCHDTKKSDKPISTCDLTSREQLPLQCQNSVGTLTNLEVGERAKPTKSNFFLYPHVSCIRYSYVKLKQ